MINQLNRNQRSEMTGQPLLYSIKSVKRRYFLLIEVLIAFAFVVVALLPLMHPHFYIFQQQSRFVDKIEMDIAVSNFYGNILQKLQTNEISWDHIQSQRVDQVSEQLWGERKELHSRPFKGHYKFEIEKSKTNKNYGAYLVKLTLEVVPNGPFKNDAEKAKKTSRFTFEIFVTRLFQTA